MRTSMQRTMAILCLLFGAECGLARAADGILSAIPSDAVGFAVVHDLSDASRSIDQVAKLLQAPAPNLLGLAKGITGLQKGLDEQGDLAIVLTTIDPTPKPVMLVPVANSADFFAALQVEEPTTGVVEIRLAGRQMLAGHKEGFAVLARATDRDALEHFLDSTTNLADDTTLASWLDMNKLSVAVTSQGVEQLLPKLSNSIRTLQTQLRQTGGEQGQTAADALNIYLKLFAAAEHEVDRVEFGLRIDSAQTVSLVKRVQFTPGGTWAKWTADVELETGDPLAGLQAGPFIVAAGGVIPPGASEDIMEFSVEMMKNQPGFKLTPEQAQKYVEITKGMMDGVHSMGMVLGVAEPGAGLYGNTSAVMNVDNSERFIDNYEKALAASRDFVQEMKVPGIPVSTSQRITLDDAEVLEVSMDLADMKQLAAPGGPDPQKMMELMAGKDDKLKIYVAPADEHTVVMVYTSLDRLKAAIAFYKSKRPGISADPSVAKVAAALPAGSQFVAYVSLGGAVKAVQEFAKLVPGGKSASIPDFPDSPPLGAAVKVSAAGAEGHLVVTAATLRSIGSVVAKVRAAAAGSHAP